MGRSGNFNGDDIIDILTKQPACAQFIGRKIWRYFIEDEPSSASWSISWRRRMPRAQFRNEATALREIFCSEEFYSERVMRSQIKSPDAIHRSDLQSARAVSYRLRTIAQNAMRQMGQILFAPPNVKGWDGGKSWISTSTLFFRNNFANYLINGDAILPAAIKRQGGDLGFRADAGGTLAEEVHRVPIDVNKIVRPEVRENPEKLIAELSRRVLQTEPPARCCDVLEISRGARCQGGRCDHSRLNPFDDEHSTLPTCMNNDLSSRAQPRDPGEVASRISRPESLDVALGMTEM